MILHHHHFFIIICCLFRLVLWDREYTFHWLTSWGGSTTKNFSFSCVSGANKQSAKQEMVLTTREVHSLALNKTSKSFCRKFFFSFFVLYHWCV